MYFLMSKMLLISNKKYWCQQFLICIFLDLLYVKCSCAKFHQCSICVTDFRESDLIHPIREQRLKGPSWVGLTKLVKYKKKSNSANPCFILVAFRTCLFNPFLSFNDEKSWKWAEETRPKCHQNKTWIFQISFDFLHFTRCDYVILSLVSG